MLELMLDCRHTYPVAIRAVAAVVWAIPALNGPLRSILPATSRTLAGWRRLEPGLSRPPVPEAVLWGIAERFLLRGRSQLAFICVLRVELYLWPSECLGLRGF